MHDLSSKSWFCIVVLVVAAVVNAEISKIDGSESLDSQIDQNEVAYDPLLWCSDQAKGQEVAIMPLRSQWGCHHDFRLWGMLLVLMRWQN